VASFDSGKPPSSLSFSENGTWLAAAGQGETSVTIWDLRNASQLKVLEIGNMVNTVRWDYTGQFLATGGPSGITVQQYTKSTKQWTEPLKSAVPALALAWGSDGQSLGAVDETGALNLLGAA
jgi:pre-mRNA-processing factor 19